MQLIKLVKLAHRMPLGFVLLMTMMVLYFFTNNYFLSAPVPVPLSSFDLWANLSPVWIWVYVSYYFFLAGIYLSVRDEQILNQIFYSYFAAGLIGGLIFFLIPTEISRELYPVAADSGLSAQMLLFMRKIDQSHNCAPSLHIAFSVIAAMTFNKDFKEYKTLRVFIGFWALLIAYSTMATKQHYFLDVVTGFLLGASVFIFFGRVNFKET